MAQKVYFDPMTSFERRLLKKQGPDGQEQKNRLQQPDYIKAQNKFDREQAEKNKGGLIQHSVKRVKKKINDYILNNYSKLFFKNTVVEPVPGTEEDTAPKEQERQTLSAEEILSHPELLTKVEAELRLSEEQEKKPRELL